MAKHKVVVAKMVLKPKLKSADPRLRAENAELRTRLQEAEETLRAIQSGEVDAVVVSGPKGEQVFTLRGAEYAYRALVEAMNEGAATIAADGTILYCNGKIAPIVQLPLNNVIGSPVQCLIADCDRDAFAGLFARALRGEPCKAEFRLQVHDGSIAPAYVSLSRLPQDGAAAVCMVVTDLREHKKRDELIAAGNLAQTILESAAEAIAVCDAEGRIILANEAVRTLCGRNPLFQRFDQVLPLDVVTRQPSGEPLTRRFSLSDALEGKGIRTQEVLYCRNHERRANGRTTWLLLTAGPLRSEDHPVGCVLTLLDITKRKKTEEVLLRTEKLAATGQLAATIAHEINNPLAAIFNLLYLMEQEPNREQVQELVRQATAELSRVSNIVKQTLAFYRETSQPEKMSLAQVLDEVLLLFRKELQARQTSVRKIYQSPGEVSGYPGEMRQVFSNLLRNAIEALPSSGQIRLHVRPSRHRGTAGVAVFITDNGSGIPAELCARIFEPFFTTKGQKGTGLGLWVAKDLVEKHGGVIQVRSSTAPPRKGTCFYVFLPVSAKPEEEPPRPASA